MERARDVVEILKSHGIQPSAQRVAVAERQFLASVNHPGIVKIYNFVEHTDDRGQRIGYIVMEYIGGRTLKQMTSESEAEGDLLSIEQAMAYILEVLPAVGYLHSVGLVYNDVKPENILLLPSGFAYLADFGIAARTNEARMTSAGTAIGSFAYMAPERFQDAPVSPACDIYSLGCVLYECLAGRPPFPRGSVSARNCSMPPV